MEKTSEQDPIPERKIEGAREKLKEIQRILNRPVTGMLDAGDKAALLELAKAAEKEEDPDEIRWPEDDPSVEVKNLFEDES